MQPHSGVVGHFSKLVDEDQVHSLPIGQMGNYQDYIKKQPVALREIESAPVRQHMFGNPFKINKNMILDEVVDEVCRKIVLALKAVTFLTVQGFTSALGNGFGTWVNLN